MAEVTYEQAYAAVEQRLSERSLSHSVRVADLAVDLAAIYGVNQDAARITGLLHDWDRDTPWDELLLRAEQTGIFVSDADRAFPYLLHGPLAAVDLPEVFPGLSRDIVDAIRVHTYGAPEISPLAQVLYIADSLEPCRDYPGVRELRELIGSVSLEVLFGEVYAAALKALIDRRRQIHPRTVTAWNELVAQPRDCR